MPISRTLTIMGGGSYWAGRAVARQLFGSCGLQLFPARPLLRPEAIGSGHALTSITFVRFKH